MPVELRGHCDQTDAWVEGEKKSGLISRALACTTVRPSFIRKYNGFIVKGILVFKKSAEYPK